MSSYNPLEHSIVHEYAILYSDRIAQRDKKWNDGTLRFYELNSKLEVSNADGNIIATDFLPSKSNSVIHDRYLRVKNQFQLPTKRLLIDIEEKISVSERDVSKSFPKKSQPSPPPPPPTHIHTTGTKINENVPIALLKLDANLLNTTAKRRKVGLTRKTKPDPSFKSPTISIDTKNAPSPIIQASNRQQDKLLKELMLRSTKLGAISTQLPRIPTSSNKSFQYLHYDFTQGARITGNKPDHQPMIQNEVANNHPVIVKSERPPPIISTTTVDDADIIYDLSDLEEDDKFQEMLANIRKEREQQEQTRLRQEQEEVGEIDF